jgi:hypothetical protein
MKSFSSFNPALLGKIKQKEDLNVEPSGYDINNDPRILFLVLIFILQSINTSTHLLRQY